MLLFIIEESEAPLVRGSKVCSLEESTTLVLRRGSRSAKESVRQFVALRTFEGGGGTGLQPLLCEYIVGALDTAEPKGSVE